MRVIAKFVLLMFALTALRAPQAQQSSARLPFSLFISTPSQKVKSGSEMKLKIAMTNLSNQQIFFGPHTGKLAPSGLIVHDRNNEPVAELSENPNGPHFGSYVRMQLNPGTTMHFERILNQEFNLTQPGKYTVQAVREYGGQTVMSNVISITVVR